MKAAGAGCGMSSGRSKDDLDPRQNGPHPHDAHRFTVCCIVLSLCFNYRITLLMSVFQLSQRSKHSTSRVLVILPAHPIRDDEV